MTSLGIIHWQEMHMITFDYRIFNYACTLIEIPWSNTSAPDKKTILLLHNALTYI